MSHQEPLIDDQVGDFERSRLPLPGPKPTEQDLQRLKDLYWRRFGVMLADEQALELGLAIVDYVFHSLYPVRPKVERE